MYQAWKLQSRTIFLFGALISKAPIVLNILILLILFVLFWTIFFFWRQDCHHVVIWATHRSSPLLKVEPFMKIHVYEINHRWKFKSFCQEYVKISSSVNLAKDDVHWNDSIIEFHLQTWRDRAETSIKLILTEKVNYIRVTAEPKIIFLWNKYQRNK